MKRIILWFSALLIVLPVGSAAAAPCYGTTMPLRHKVIGGLQSYSLLRRNLEDDYGTVKSSQYFFLLSYGLADWFCLDGKIGTGNSKARPQVADGLRYESAFAGGYGFRLRLYQNQAESVTSVFGFQHISVHPYAEEDAAGKHKAILDDWQVSFLTSLRISRLVPYLGVKWSRVDYIHRLNNDRKRIMSDFTRSIGLVAGIDIPLLKDRVFLNLEGHCFDETAASGSVMYAF